MSDSCSPMDCSLPGSSVHGILQAVLEWAAISFSRGSSWPRNRTWVSCIAGWFFTDWAKRKVHMLISCLGGFFFFFFYNIVSKESDRTERLNWTEEMYWIFNKHPTPYQGDYNIVCLFEHRNGKFNCCYDVETVWFIHPLGCVMNIVSSSHNS